MALAAWRVLAGPRLSSNCCPGAAIAGAGQALQLPVVFRIVLSEVPPARAGVGSGVMITTQQSALALGVATLGTLFLVPDPGHGHAGRPGHDASGPAGRGGADRAAEPAAAAHHRLNAGEAVATEFAHNSPRKSPC